MLHARMQSDKATVHKVKPRGCLRRRCSRCRKLTGDVHSVKAASEMPISEYNRSIGYARHAALLAPDDDVIIALLRFKHYLTKD